MTKRRFCACGCGKRIPDSRSPAARYLDDKHMRRARQRRHRARVFERGVAADRARFEVGLAADAHRHHERERHRAEGVER